MIQAITLRYFDGERIPATSEIVYHAARSAFTVADEANIQRVATYLWAIRDGTARPARMAEMLIRAAAGHSRGAVNLNRIAICEQSSDANRYRLAVQSMLQVRDLWAIHPHAWQGCGFPPS